MSATPHDGAGTLFSFGGTSFTVTNIVVTNTDPAADDTIDISHLGLTAGNSIRTISRPLQGSATDTGREVVVDYLGTNIIKDASTGTLTLTVNGSTAISASATVSSSTLTFATNDAVRGQVTFKVARY
jgi:Ca2+-binding RTX toxin-like protein